VTAPGRPPAKIAVRVDGALFVVEIEDVAAGGLAVRVNGQAVDVDTRLDGFGSGSLLLDGVSHVVDQDGGSGETTVVVDGEAFRVQIEGNATQRRGGPTDGHPGGGQRLVAPMPGKVAAVLVAVGQPVERGAGLVVLEAMKMENEFRATGSGIVTEIRVSPGQTVNAGDLLVVVA
jgi:biotin carboxyl carrier protein